MRNKAEDIAMVLRLLGEGRFFYETRENGTAIVFKDYEATLKELEDFFGLELQDFLLNFDTYEDMVRSWDDKATAGLIESFLSGETADRLKRELRGKPYHEVLLACYKAWWPAQVARPLAREILNAREQISAPQMAAIEDLWVLHAGEGLSESLACVIASRLGALYPKILQRAERLRALPAVTEFPEKVQPYLKEATRCYLFGQFLAGCALCRSIVEFALRDFLVRVGRERDLRSVEMRDGDGLLALISLVRLVAGREYGAILDHADEIRRRVNRALHQEPLDDQTCIDLFTKTRGVLKQLYA